MLSKRTRILVFPVIAAMVAVHAPVGMSQAAMVGTDEIIAPEAHNPYIQPGPQVSEMAESARADIHALLERDDMQAQLQEWGVSPAEAHARIAALSDSEILMLSDRIANDPAGQGVLETALVAAAVAAIVLFFTDLLGLTNVYPFLRTRRTAGP
jgi:hypothetical protein